MATKPKKRMKYPPKSARKNNIVTVLSNIATLSSSSEWLSEVMLINHSSIDSMVIGQGNAGVFNNIVSMCNVVRGLVLRGFGEEYADIVLKAQDALEATALRVQKTNSYTLYATEIVALKDLLELHDEQIKQATFSDIAKILNDLDKDKKKNRMKCLSLKYDKTH